MLARDADRHCARSTEMRLILLSQHLAAEANGTFSPIHVNWRAWRVNSSNTVQNFRSSGICLINDAVL
jgi:hypothetical protein